jgi:23S rRNA (uracil1939-C5)-methyltransferase
MFAKGQLIQLDIQDAGDRDACFGKLEEGISVFVAGPVAVGDRVEASITKIKRNYLEARLTRLLVPSPTRIAPACAHFGMCGGCKWQHVHYSEQLRIKRKIVADALAHIGGFSSHPVLEPVPSPREYGYRNKIEFSFGDRRFLLPEEMGGADINKPRDYALGFHAPGRFDKVVDIDQCHLAPPEMNAALSIVKTFCRERRLSVYSTQTHEGYLRNLVVRKSFALEELMIYLVTSSYQPSLMRELDAELAKQFGDRLTTFVNGVTNRKNTVAHGDEHYTLRGPGHIVERLGALRFAISPTSFFQTNSLQAERLFDEVMRAASLTGNEVVHDLYCGTGAISLWLASRARKVIGCELEASSLRDAEINARANGLRNVRFIPLDLRHYARAVRELSAEERPDVVIVDPPRAGLHPDLAAELRALRPTRIVYVSCNPASLARDAKILCADGCFRMGAVQPVDLFPQTAHIESVVALERA